MDPLDCHQVRRDGVGLRAEHHPPQRRAVYKDSPPFQVVEISVCFNQDSPPFQVVEIIHQCKNFSSRTHRQELPPAAALPAIIDDTGEDCSFFGGFGTEIVRFFLAAFGH